MSRKRKPAEEKAGRHNLTFNPRVWKIVEDRVKKDGYSSSAAYLAELIRRDAANSDQTREAADLATEAAASQVRKKKAR